MSDSEQDTKPNKDKSITVQLYAAFGACLILSLMPDHNAALIASILCIVILIWGEIVKNKSPKTSLQHNHATYIIRTIWIASLIAIPSLGLAIFYMLKYVDQSALMPCMDNLMGMIGSVDAESGSVNIDTSHIENITSSIQACMDNYMSDNSRVFTLSMVLAAGPVVAYAIWRYLHGLMRAIHGHRLANPRKWF